MKPNTLLSWRTRLSGWGVGVTLVLVTAMPTIAQGPPDDPGPAEAARTARESFGLGPTDVLPAIVGDAAHEQMIDAAIVATTGCPGQAVTCVASMSESPSSGLRVGFGIFPSIHSAGGMVHACVAMFDADRGRMVGLRYWRFPLDGAGRS